VSNLEHDETIAASLGALAREGLDDAPFDHAHGRARLLARAERESGFFARFDGRWLAAAALAAVALFALWRALPGALRYEVEGVTASGGYVSAPADHPATLRFSDDSRVEVAKGSQVRVESTSSRGARVFLERGSASVHVVHQRLTEWTFVAGPCEVEVTGTRFELDWDPARDVFAVRLREGSVLVQTPLGPERVALRAGQEFRADLRRRATSTSETSAAAKHDAPAAEPQTAPVPPVEAPLGMDAPRAADAASAKPSWSKLVAGGEFKAVLAQADARGVPKCLSSCSAADLGALADAARYTGRTALAAESLNALRSRFPGEPSGRAAAFLLGRSSESRGATSEARTWYERYLGESPKGSYAAEALAGKMRTTLVLSGSAAAQPIARDYLRLYPAGVHAGTARDILASR
jgi:hypothetical protein